MICMTEMSDGIFSLNLDGTHWTMKINFSPLTCSNFGSATSSSFKIWISIIWLISRYLRKYWVLRPSDWGRREETNKCFEEMISRKRNSNFKKFEFQSSSHNVSFNRLKVNSNYLVTHFGSTHRLDISAWRPPKPKYKKTYIGSSARAHLYTDVC